jgi:hypothetical protein
MKHGQGRFGDGSREVLPQFPGAGIGVLEIQDPGPLAVNLRPSALEAVSRVTSKDSTWSFSA